MSYNKLVNAMIALIEDRPHIAREMLRSPEIRVSSTEVQVRLHTAIKNREETAIADAFKSVLRVSLRADAEQVSKNLNITWDDSHKEAFLQGVAYVEDILENYIGELKS